MGAKGKEKDGYSFLKRSLPILFVPYSLHAEYNALHMVGLSKCLFNSIFKAEVPIHLVLKKEDLALLKFLTQTSEGDIANLSWQYRVLFPQLLALIPMMTF